MLRVRLLLAGMSLWVMSAFTCEANMIEGGETTSLAPFSQRYGGGQTLSESGKKHWQWSGNCWDPNGQGEVFLDDAQVAGKRAIGLRNLSGRPSVQLYNWKPFALSAGTRYTLMFSYLTQGQASGNMIIKGKSLPETSHPLAGTGGMWKAVKVLLAPRQDGDLSLMFQNLTEGPSNVLYVADLTLDAETRSIAPAAAAATPSQAPVLLGVRASEMQPFVCTCTGTDKYSGDHCPDPFSFNLWDAGSSGEVRLATVDGQKALAVTNLSGKGAAQLYTWKSVPVQASRRYAVQVTYRGEGTLMAVGDGLKGVSLSLKSSTFTTALLSVRPTRDCDLSVNIQNYAMGAAGTFYLSELRIVDQGPIAAGEPVARR